MSPSERREMICKENTDLSLTRQFKLLKVSRSSIYDTPVGMNSETLKLCMKLIGCSQNTRFLATARSQPTFPDLGSQLGGIESAL